MVSKFQKIKRADHYQSIFFAAFFGILIVIFVWFLITSNLKMYQKRSELQAKVDAFKKEVQALEEKNAGLQAQVVESTQTDYLEKEARERFNLQKPGEEVAVILPAEKKEEPPKEESGEWWNIFNW